MTFLNRWKKMNPFHSNTIEQKHVSVILTFVLLMSIFLKQITYIDWINQENIIVDNLIRSLYYINYVFIVLTWIILIFKKKIKFDSILLIWFLGISLSLTYMLFPQNLKYIHTQNIITYLIYSITVYSIVRSKLFKFDIVEKSIINISRVVSIIILIQLFLVLEGNTTSSYMDYSDSMTLVGAFLLYSGLLRKNKFDLILGITVSLSIFIFGARGAFITILLYIFILYLFYKNNYKKLIVTVTLLSLILVLIISFNSIIQAIINFCNENGIDSRTISYLYSQGLFSSQSRLNIYEYLIDILGENVFGGVGIAGDRYYLPLRFIGVDATYAHNLFLELLLHYGVIIGMVLITIIMYLIVRYFILNTTIDYKIKCFIGIFFTMSFIQLMISRSYLTETNFFIFLAMVMNCSNKRIVS
jgi:hypothetical protein